MWRRFKKLGLVVFFWVLDVVWSIVSSNVDVVEVLLWDIDNDFDCSEIDIIMVGINIVFGDNWDGDGVV